MLKLFQHRIKAQNRKIPKQVRNDLHIGHIS
jgi:hypothetical protein